MRYLRMLATAITATVLLPATTNADTLLVVGVAVDKNGQRIPGALVRLYGTSHPVGQALVEDRTSERGIFSLYRTNIAGDLGDLYVIYDSDGTNVAAPLKVSLVPVQQGLIQSRTADLVVLAISSAARLSEAEAAERIAAITQTQAVLLEAKAITKEQADRVLTTRTATVMAGVGAVGVTVKEAKQVDALTSVKLRDLGTLDVGPLRDLASIAILAGPRP